MSIENIFSELWLAAFWGPLAVGLILFLLSKFFSGKNEEKIVTFKYVREVVVKHVVEVKERKRASRPVSQTRRSGARNGRDDPAPALIGIGLLFLSFFYAKHQTEVVAVVLGFSTFILSFVLFTVFFGISKNIAHDHSWTRYLYTTLFLALLGYPLMYIALNPIYAPLEVNNMSSIVMDGGLASMFKNFGLKGVGFLMFQALGFLTLAIAMLLQTLSLVFYTSVIQLAVSPNQRPIINFVAQITSKFRSPNKMIAFSIVLYVFSFVLISGVGYEWWYSAANNHVN
ncbi:MAG: hypothetical protein V7765_06520 [Oleispira sp.]